VERDPALSDTPRRAGHRVLACAVARAGRASAGAHARLAGLGPRVREHSRTAHRSRRVRWFRRRRLPRGRPSAPRVWVQRTAPRTRLESRMYRAGVGRLDDSARVPTVRRTGRRLGRLHKHRTGPSRPGTRRWLAPHHAGGVTPARGPSLGRRQGTANDRERQPVPDRRLRLRLRDDPTHPPADDRVLAGRLAIRARRVARREIGRHVRYPAGIRRRGERGAAGGQHALFWFTGDRRDWIHRVRGRP
jgi:hypothetical protein